MMRVLNADAWRWLSGLLEEETEPEEEDTTIASWFGLLEPPNYEEIVGTSWEYVKHWIRL
jgi:hypothetical protein